MGSAYTLGLRAKNQSSSLILNLLRQTGVDSFQSVKMPPDPQMLGTENPSQKEVSSLGLP